MTLNLLENFHSSIINTLDWSTFQGSFAQFSHFTTNQHYLNTNQVFKNNESLKKHYHQLKIIQDEFDNDEQKFVKRFQYIQTSTELINEKILELTKGQFLDIPALNILVNILESEKDLKPHLKKTCQEFRLICEPDGTDKIESHPRLRKITHELYEIDSYLRQQVSKSDRGIGFDVFYDRFCLMIKSDQFTKNDGSILAHSKTGNTLYVEPLNIKKHNEKRIALIAERDQIIFTLLREIADQLSPHHNEIKNALWKLIDLDLKLAIIRFNEFYQLSYPTITNDHTIKFEDLFHPLINKPIKNTFEKTPEKNLIISGANTGGKTVLLKAITLSLLFAKKGLGGPNTHAEFNLPEKIFFYSQDGQNIKEGLSSYSSEVEFYINALEETDESSIVVIDEIFNSTSSDEASVLAYAFFKEFSLKKANLFASTHHKNLKELIDKDQDFTNAFMEFDFHTLTPTYKLTIGSFDSSHALDIFERVAKASPYFQTIKDRAYQNLNQQFIDYDQALREVKNLSFDLEQQKLTVRQTQEELARKLNDIDGSMTLKKQQEMLKLSKEIEDLKKEALTILDDIKTGKKTNKNKIDYAFTKLIPNPKKEQKSDVTLKRPDKFELDKDYFYPKLNQNVTLISEQNGKARVRAPLGLMNCNLNDLYKALKEKQIPKTAFKNFLTDFSHEAKIEHDCRGMRLDTFQQLVDTALSDLLLEAVPYINIIHGHGDGILKSWLKEKIKQEKEFTLKPGPEGNDGISVIELS